MSREHLVEVLSRELELYREEEELRGMKEKELLFSPPSIVTALSQLSEVQDCVDKYINRGNGGFSIGEVDAIAYGLFMQVIDNGVEAATNCLFDFFVQDYSQCLEVVFLHGIEVAEPFEVCDGVFIANLADVPSDSVKRFIKWKSKTSSSRVEMSKPLGDYFESRQMPEAALYRLTNVRPKFIPDGGRARVEVDPEREILLRKVVKLLPLLGLSSVISWHNLSEFKAGSFLNYLASSSGGAAFKELEFWKGHVATLEELQSFKVTLAAYLNLTEKQRDKFDVPLHRYNEAVGHIYAVDKAIDLGVALEALLLRDNSNNEQLGLQFRMRGAWLLGRDATERQEIFTILKKLYNCRSSAVHSGKLGKTPKESEAAPALLEQGLKLCADAIKALIFAKEVSWEALILGASADVESSDEDGIESTASEAPAK